MTAIVAWRPLSTRRPHPTYIGLKILYKRSFALRDRIAACAHAAVIAHSAVVKIRATERIDNAYALLRVELKHLLKQMNRIGAGMRVFIGEATRIGVSMRAAKHMIAGALACALHRLGARRSQQMNDHI